MIPYEAARRSRGLPDLVKAALVLPCILVVAIVAFGHFDRIEQLYGTIFLLSVGALIGIAIMFAVKIMLLFNQWLNDRLR